MMVMISLSIHMITGQDRVCVQCVKNVLQLNGIWINTKLSHTGDKLYSCNQCDKRFTAHHYLRRHMNVHNSKYKCIECGKCFTNNQKLTKHKWSHSGEKPFECTVCGKRFNKSDKLLIHSRIHSGKKLYKCLECGKVYS